MSLSAWMTIKTSVVGLPLGGGKGGIIVDPKQLSQAELQRLTRAFTQKIAPYIGPLTDVPAPDVNTNGQIMAWIVDEYSRLQGKRTPGVVTGKPEAIGGSAGRGAATSMGGRYVLQQYLSNHNDVITAKTVAIQGAGNAGLTFARIAADHGAKIVAISDSKGAIYDPQGLDIAAIEQLKNTGKSVQDHSTGTKISNDELLALEVDILVPAALEQAIHEANVASIKAHIILELANGPVTPDADKNLESRNITVIPDVLANAGGVTVSYFEQVQNNTNYYRDEQEVDTKLYKIMTQSTQKVIETASTHKVSLRTASYIVALDRVLTAQSLKTNMSS